MSTVQTKNKSNWLLNFLSSTIGRKLLMALTGTFLILFLLVHLIGNLQLLIPDDGKSFNEYAYFMGHNKFIQFVSIGNFFFIVLHIIVSIVLTLANQKARPVQYAYQAKDQKSSAASRQMMVLGSIILLFLIMHLAHFWAKSKFGGLTDIELTGGVKGHNLYAETVAVFKEWWIVAIYVVCMIGVAFHLLHGFQSAFQTFGLNHQKYTPLIKTVGLAFAILVPFLYALIPLLIFIQNQ
ncbi:MAG: succinate dehydrogenase [Bacteroidetes bacterium]|nr:MAG: succinate dehydrogenase [Bacteroidota bacterium]TAG88301.1 MAG: succinate dehydrogenase [Bacteroidota bacterium]